MEQTNTKFQLSQRFHNQLLHYSDNFSKFVKGKTVCLIACCLCYIRYLVNYISAEKMNALVISITELKGLIYNCV